MKSIFTLSFILLCFYNYASHIAGGEITAKQLNGTSYEVNLVLYRDYQGVPPNPNYNLNVKNTAGQSLGTGSFTFHMDSLNSFDTITLHPQFYEGYLRYVYRDTIDFLNPGEYSISYNECCRNNSVINIINSSSYSMMIETILTVNSNNSSPKFLAAPVMSVPINQDIVYNPLPVDLDGDSLAWYIDTTKESMNTTMPYSAVSTSWTIPQTDPSNPFTIDPITADITWKSNMTGAYAFGIVVEEYRNGVKIGEIRRDCQFIVNNSGQTTISTGWSPFVISNQGNSTLTSPTGVPFSISFSASNPGGAISVSAYGAMFSGGTSQPASFSVVPSGNGNELSANFSWMPTQADVSNSPYLLSFRISDGYFAQDTSVLLYVTSTSEVDDLSKSSFSLYPNPSNNGVLNITMDDENIESIHIFNSSGQLVHELNNIHSNKISYQTNITTKGIYILNIKTKSGISQRKWIVQ